MDDDLRHLFDTAELPEESAHGVAAEFLVHHVAFGHQRRHPRLLPAGTARVGLGQSQVEPRPRELPHSVGRHRIQLHVANFLAHPRGQHGGPFKVRNHAQLVPRCCCHLQGAVRMDVLPHLPGKINLS